MDSHEISKTNSAAKVALNPISPAEPPAIPMVDAVPSQVNLPHRAASFLSDGNIAYEEIRMVLDAGYLCLSHGDLGSLLQYDGCWTNKWWTCISRLRVPA